MKRLTRAKQDGGGGRVLVAPSNLRFVKTGCTLLDLVLGGGWPLGRIANIVGDKSTGKTLLAIESCANFCRQYPNGKIWYRESESAFDKPYAAALGMPIHRVKFKKVWTVEDLYEDLEEKAYYLKQSGKEGLYIIDSLDALSDRRELDRKIDTPTYGQNKAAQMSQLFRRLAGHVEAAQLSLIVISQVRDDIGAMFGRKTKRSGGRALNFYASQIVYLQHLKTVYRTRNNEERAVAINIRANCDKNKVSQSHRECDFPIRFNFGIEDLQANVGYLKKVGKLKLAGLTLKDAKPILATKDNLSREEYYRLLKATRKTVKRCWYNTEKAFLPRWSKYNGY